MVMISTARSVSGRTCVRPFFTRSAGSVSVRLFMSISLHRKPPISSRRHPVSVRSFTILPWSSSPLAHQTTANSAAVSTRSRGVASSGRFVPTTGLIGRAPDILRPSPIEIDWKARTWRVPP